MRCFKVAQIGGVQFAVQFGLPGQDHLNQFALPVLKIAQEPISLRRTSVSSCGLHR